MDKDEHKVTFSGSLRDGGEALLKDGGVFVIWVTLIDELGREQVYLQQVQLVVPSQEQDEIGSESADEDKAASEQGLDANGANSDELGQLSDKEAIGQHTETADGEQTLSTEAEQIKDSILAI